jgi:hypothetical protein
MIDFSNISFITHARFDTQERIDNLKIRTNFYHKYPNIQQIFCEDSQTPQLLNQIELNENDLYLFRYNKDEWNKCLSYNLGFKLTTRPILCFIDIDVIIHPDAILETAKYLIEDPQIGLMYPYNGLFLCVDPLLKKEFGEKFDYNVFDAHYPTSKQINFNNGKVTVGHNNSVGGIVMIHRDAFIKCNGYNPNFKGWGYEDNEIPHRFHILGYNVQRLNKSYPLWHMPHDGVGSGKKADNPYYEQNRILCQKIESLSKIQLEEYIKEWQI